MTPRNRDAGLGVDDPVSVKDAFNLPLARGQSCEHDNTRGDGRNDPAHSQQTFHPVLPGLQLVTGRQMMRSAS